MVEPVDRQVPGIYKRWLVMLTMTAAGRVYDYSHNVGQYMGGTRWPGEGFVLPVATAVARDGSVYVLGRGAESTEVGRPLEPRAFGARVGKFVMDQPGQEQHVLTFGEFGTADAQFIWPAGIALDSRERVYVSDEWLNRISVFDSEGRFVSAWGSTGSGDAQFDRISGIAIDAGDLLYAVDSLNHRVQKLTVDGEFLTEWGRFGDGAGEFNSPWGVAVDEHGHVYVADHLNHRVQRFTPDGEFLGRFGTRGSGRGELYRPSDVAVDSEGDVYVCDWANNRVQVFAADGGFVTSILGDAHEPSRWAQGTLDANADLRKARRRAPSMEPEWRFALPTGVTFDRAGGRLIVADTQRYRVQVYLKLTDYVDAQFNL